MKGDVSRAGLGKIRDNAIHRLDHQVHVYRRGHAVLAQRLAYQGTDGQIWHIMVVHHVKVHDVCACGEYVINFLTEPGEVGGKNTGSDFIHGNDLT